MGPLRGKSFVLLRPFNVCTLGIDGAARRRRGARRNCRWDFEKVLEDELESLIFLLGLN